MGLPRYRRRSRRRRLVAVQVAAQDALWVLQEQLDALADDDDTKDYAWSCMRSVVHVQKIELG